jgi:hypothetical protein
MDETKLAAMLGQALGTGAAVAVLLLILWRVLKGIAERWIASLDANTRAIAEHTTRDIDSHRELGNRMTASQAELSEKVVRVEVKLDSALSWLDRDRTPSEVERERETAPHRRRRTPLPQRDPHE